MMDTFGLLLGARRKKVRNKFMPGQQVRVKKHGIEDETYDSVWLNSVPGDDVDAERYELALKSLAIVIGIYDLEERWLLLLASNGLLGWTAELEGLEILPALA